MLRRHLLKLTAGTTLGALAVRVLAFEDKNALPDLAAARRKASAAGRAVLVFVVADDPAARHQNGVALGAFLNYGSEEDLASIAMTDVVCATPGAIREIAPKAAIGVDPLLVLVAPTSEGSEPRVVSFALDREKEITGVFRGSEGRTYEQIQKDDAERIEARNARIAKFLFTELGAERAKEWAALAKPALGPKEVAELEAPVLDVGALSPERLRAGAAVLLARVSGSTGKDRAQVVGALAKLVRGSIVDVPPAGAKWARSSGCGMTIEGEEQELRVACGMGMVPEKEQRFLFLLAKDGK